MKIHILAFALTMVALPPAARAQRADSIPRVGAVSLSAIVDTLHPPLTPRRAFFYSFVLPGYSQTVLGRDKAAAGFLLVEAISIGMIRESGADVHEARRSLNDTLVISYVDA